MSTVVALAVAPASYGFEVSLSDHQGWSTDSHDLLESGPPEADRKSRRLPASEHPSVRIWVAPQEGLWLAQSDPLDSLPFEQRPPSQEPLPEFELPPPLPPPEDLIKPQQPIPETPPPVPGEVPETVVVERFEVVGSTVFTEEELTAVTAPFTNRPLSFNELFQVRSQITDLYASAGYITSAAIIPPQTLSEGVVRIEVIEGRLEAVQVTGNQRLRADYVSSRIAPYATAPLQIERLLEGLQLLQLDPLIRRASPQNSQPGRNPAPACSASPSTRPRLAACRWISTTTVPPASAAFSRCCNSPKTTSVAGAIGCSSVWATVTAVTPPKLGYRTFVNPQNATVELTLGGSLGEVLEGDLELLDIDSRSFFVEATWRQPLVRTPEREWAIGATFTRQQSEAYFLGNLFGQSVPFPAIGADDNGVSTVSALRLFTDWVRQGERQVLAFRSQLSLGLGNVLGGTVQDEARPSLDPTLEEPRPDNQFLSWSGQAQWVRLLAPDTLLLLQANAQWGTGSLLPAEQFRLGGQTSVRGYRQDFLLVDRGISASAEVRLPLYRTPLGDQLLQVTPFFDVGAGWNNRQTPEDNFLAAIGVGLLWQQPNLTARVDWGIPLVSVDSFGDSLQENGLYFSLVYRPTW
ncbi:ShlB/FhaC/HecB family hemolysin secretion/activation protein [Halomicronema hongdechloris]|uniref:ShlB/FhaC/HecB family hemolysin secretion/activation protein n=1 Tax=Halomicronema hongdechloris TaxID=1209493 RepID=UPI0016512688|nr:POTRA domain-containing protein [Halomicronema hongdechloris]